jgi:hypothetical protein
VKPRDRILRRWNPGGWRDKHPEVSDGDGFALSGEQSHSDAGRAESSITKAMDDSVGA